MVNKKLFLLILVFCYMPLQGMIVVPFKKRKLEITAPLISPTLCDVLQQPFCDVSVLCKPYSILKDAAKVINSLARVNKCLNQYMNNADRTLDWIKELSEKFDIANSIVARTLCTSAAKDRYFLQKSAIENSPYESPLSEIKICFGKGLDLNFTYNTCAKYAYKHKISLLSFFLCSNDKVVDFLIEKGADINKYDRDGDNVCMTLLKNKKIDAFERLSKHPKLDIDHQDCNGNTALHVCMREMPYARDIENFINSHAYQYAPLRKAMEILLERKANPTIKNNAGYTALGILALKDWDSIPNKPDSPEKTICLEIIAALQQAEKDWKNHG